MFFYNLNKKADMQCIICTKTEEESYEKHKKILNTLTSVYTSIFKQIPKECTYIIAEYVIGNKPWYSIEVWNWISYTSYFERDYDYILTYKNACRSCLEASTAEFYSIHGTTPCQISDYLENIVNENEIRGEPSGIYSPKKAYFRDFVCDGWSNTPPYYQQNLLGEYFVTL